MKPSCLILSICLWALQTDLSFAYWRMACSVSQTARIDPILNPGGVSGHAHKFAGGSSVNENSDHDSLLSSTCSSCEVQKDKSAYWTPQLYFAHANGEFEEVPNYGMTVYYVGRGGNTSNTVPFPKGFKMISGDTRQRSYDSSTLTYLDTRPVADRVSFRCINEANDIPETHYISQTNCVNGLRAQLNFQSCWDGVNNYLENSAHVAYLSGIDYGECPPTHPVPIPGLFFEVLYLPNLIDQSAGGQFVFSNGDPTGFGFHGDFMNGWDMDVHTEAVKNCLYTDNNGVISACSYLAESDDVNFARTCPEQASVLDEPVHGNLTALPGCNPITPGPGLAEQVICPVNSHSSSTSGTSSVPAGTSSALESSVSSSIIVATSSIQAPTSSTTSLPAALSSSISTSAIASNPTTSTATVSSSPGLSMSSLNGLPGTTSTTVSNELPLTTSASSTDDAASTSPISTAAITSSMPSSSETTPTGSLSTDAGSTSLWGHGWFTRSGSGWPWRGGGVFAQLSSTTDGTQASISISSTEASQDNTSGAAQTTTSATSAPSLANTVGADGLSATTLPVVTQTELLTTTITDWLTTTVTVTVGGNTAGNFVAISSSADALSGSVAPTTKLSSTLAQSNTAVTVPSSAVAVPTSTITLPDGVTNDGVPNVVTVITVTTVIPGTTIVQSGTTVSIDATTTTQPVSVVSSAGNFYTITGSTYTTFFSSDPSAAVSASGTPLPANSFSAGGTLYTITGSTTTTFLSDDVASTMPGGSLATGQPSTSLSGGITYPTTGSAYTTAPVTGGLSSSTEPTTTTTVLTTTTLFVTVTPTSTRTVSTLSTQPTAPSNSTFITVTSATAGEVASSSNNTALAPSSATFNDALSSVASLSDDVATAFVTLTEPITEETTSTVDTTLTLSTAPSNTTFFTIKGREVTYTGN
ncbi:hypothetical protein ABEF95_012761 [Exophiala dermatitidis]